MPQPPSQPVPDDPPPFLGTWRRVYIGVLIYLAVVIVALLPVHAGLSMRPLDWIVLVASLVSIIAYGLYRSRGSNTVDRYLLAGTHHAVVRHGAFHHGHAGQRHHLHLHHRPILRRWHALRAVLLRAADRDGDHLRDGRARSSTAPRSTPRTSTWRSASTRKTRALASLIFLCAARPFGGADDLRAGHRAVGDSGMAGAR